MSSPQIGGLIAVERIFKPIK